MTIDTVINNIDDDDDDDDDENDDDIFPRQHSICYQNLQATSYQ